MSDTNWYFRDADKPPERLYHYTSVDNLALILNNRTIRFNCLKNVDDLQESKTKDLKNFGNFFYVSCWTDEKEESIPMWSMYAGMEAGVRIGLKTNPFKKYDDELSEDSPFSTQLPFHQMKELGIYCRQYRGLVNPVKVRYTNSQDRINPTIVSLDQEGSIQFDLSFIGKYKSQYWSFQKEWRYILEIFPFKYDVQNPLKEIESKLTRTFINIKEDKLISNMNYFDLTISDQAFDGMEIVLSPKISLGNELLIRRLLEKVNINKENIHNSQLKDLLR